MIYAVVIVPVDAIQHLNFNFKIELSRNSVQSFNFFFTCDRRRFIIRHFSDNIHGIELIRSYVSAVCHVIPITLDSYWKHILFAIIRTVNGNPIMNRDGDGVDDVDPFHLFNLISFVIQLDFLIWAERSRRIQGQWQCQWCDRTTNSDKSSFYESDN